MGGSLHVHVKGKNEFHVHVKRKNKFHVSR